MTEIPASWKRTLTVLEGMMEGHVADLDGYRVTVRETVQGSPALVVLAKKFRAGEEGDEEEVALGLDWSLEVLAAAVSRMPEEDFVKFTGDKALNRILRDKAKDRGSASVSSGGGSDA